VTQTAVGHRYRWMAQMLALALPATTLWKRLAALLLNLR
jgi:hypothetical protein